MATNPMKRGYVSVGGYTLGRGREAAHDTVALSRVNIIRDWGERPGDWATTAIRINATIPRKQIFTTTNVLQVGAELLFSYSEASPNDGHRVEVFRGRVQDVSYSVTSEDLANVTIVGTDDLAAARLKSLRGFTQGAPIPGHDRPVTVEQVLSSDGQLFTDNSGYEIAACAAHRGIKNLKVSYALLSQGNTLEDIFKPYGETLGQRFYLVGNKIQPFYASKFADSAALCPNVLKLSPAAVVGSFSANYNRSDYFNDLAISYHTNAGRYDHLHHLRTEADYGPRGHVQRAYTDAVPHGAGEAQRVAGMYWQGYRNLLSLTGVTWHPYADPVVKFSARLAGQPLSQYLAEQLLTVPAPPPAHPHTLTPITLAPDGAREMVYVPRQTELNYDFSPTAAVPLAVTFSLGHGDTSAITRGRNDY
ncbi:hypothetical protein ACUH93_07030 [Dermabacteraceae bacterium P7006]